MSLYYVQKLLFKLNRDPAQKQRFDEDRDAVLAQYTFTDEEIQALRNRTSVCFTCWVLTRSC